MIIACRLTPSKAPATAASPVEGRTAATPQGGARPPPRAFAASLLASADDDQVRTGVQALARAADLGDTESQVALAGVLRAGHRAVARDLGAARALYGRAAQADHPSAAYFLASMCAAGEGAPRDASEAARWWSRAVDLGSPHAMFMLANAYRAGSGVPRDERRALALYQQAAEKELPAALQTLAIVYERGELGVTADEDEARRLGMEAAHAIVHPVQAP
jgi:TPR repeat protein